METRNETARARRAWSWLALVLPLLTLFLALGCLSPQTRFQAEEEHERDKDLEVPTIGDATEVANVAPIILSGVGLVTGLDGTGGGAPPGVFRTMLETQLRQQKVGNAKELLASPDNALVLVSAIIPAGARKGDPLDVEVTLPPNSKVTSLRGGYLHECVLRNYDSKKHLNPEYQGADKLLPGHILGKAKGPLLVGFGDEDEGRLRRGHIWEGGLSLIDRPFYLVLNNDQKFARVANSVAERINAIFQDDPRHQAQVLQNKRLLVLDEVTNQINDTFKTPLLGKGEMAKAVNKEIVYVRVPWEYRLNPERFLRVVRLMPLRETPEGRGRYRHRLADMLQEPKTTLRASLRLEALGKESVTTLQRGLKSEHPLVRFCSAEALAYLGSPSGAAELGSLAEQHDLMRAYCLTALASLDEMVCREKLIELLASPSAETRYGAFRALRLMDEQKVRGKNEPDLILNGELLNEAFWMHKVAPQSAALVHISINQRAEIVLFGEPALVVPPVKVLAGQEFTVTADEGDDRCTVSRFMAQQGRIVRRQCSLKLEDVLRTLADLGAQYPDVVELLRRLDEQKGLNCVVRVNAVPAMLAVEDLAAAGRDPNLFRDNAPR